MSASTRDPSQTPYASDSVFNLPLGSNAQWQSNDQLSGANIFVNTTTSGYNQNIYTGSDSDPLVTVSNSGGAGGEAGTFTVHIPADAVPSPGNDRTLAVDDTTTHTWYSFGGFAWTGDNTATATQGSGESDSGSGMDQSGSNYDEAVGTLRESDLQSGSIDHMLRIQLPTDMLMSWSNSTSDLAPFAWPQTQEDGFAVNGNGGTPYSGTVPFGVTLGIPASTAEPDAVKGNAGADMLWHALQDHGAMIRDSAGSGNTVTLQADQDVSESDPLIQGMDQFGSQIMGAVQILTNQGPDSVNGGGTPVVALDAPVSGETSSSSSSGTDSGSTTEPSSGGSGDTSSSTGGSTSGSASSSSSGSTSDSTAASTGGSTSDATTSGPAGDSGTSGDSATITSDSLSGGQTGSTGSSGMTFVTSPQNSGSSGSQTDTSLSSASAAGTGSNTGPATGSTSGLTDISNLTPPTPPSTSTSFSHWHDGSGGSGQGTWSSHHQSQVSMPAHQG